MCVSPFDIVIESRVTGRKRAISVPCGTCIQCVKQRQNDWKIRITKECESWSHVYFFTLTYKDSKLPCTVCFPDVFDDVLFFGVKPACEEWRNLHAPDAEVYSTVNFLDVRNWLKRFRTNYERSSGSKWNCKYFICSEYGPNPRGTKRPHYHGIFMTDLSKNELQPMFNEWAKIYGRIQFDECGITREDKSSVANYVSKYCSKGSFESRQEDISCKRISRAYSCMSKNIALNWISEHANDWLKYIPSFISVEGDWDIDLVSEYFEKFKNTSLADYESTMLELDNLIDNLRVFDGNNYSYKMPRYFYNFLFGKRINDEKNVILTSHGNPCFSIKPVFNYDCPFRHFAFYECPFPITVNSKLAKNTRYVSSSFVSASIAYRLRMQFITKYRADFDRLVEQGCSDFEAFSILYNREKSANFHRKQDAETRLSNFYISNMWKHREFDFESEGSLDYNILTNLPC